MEHTRHLRETVGEIACKAAHWFGSGGWSPRDRRLAFERRLAWKWGADGLIRSANVPVKWVHSGLGSQRNGLHLVPCLAKNNSLIHPRWCQLKHRLPDRTGRGIGSRRICRYRSKGFVLTGVLWWDYLGPQDNAHLVAYQVGLIRCDTLVWCLWSFCSKFQKNPLDQNFLRWCKDSPELRLGRESLGPSWILVGWLWPSFWW